MAIYNYCTKCYSTSDIKLKKCPKCEASFTKHFRIEVMVNGKRVRKVVPGLTLAKQLEAKLKAELLTGDYFDRSEGNYTLNEVWDSYHASRENVLKSLIKTKRKYDYIIRPVFGTKLIRTITPEIMEQFKIKLSKSLTRYGTPYSAKSIRDIVMIISALFNFAIKTLQCQINNPCEHVSMPKINNEVMNILTPEQKQSLLKVLAEYKDQNTANAIKLLLYTGMRLNEVLKLEWRDIDFASKILYIRDPKSGHDETIPLNETALGTLVKQREIIPVDCVMCFPGQRILNRSRIEKPWIAIKKSSRN